MRFADAETEKVILQHLPPKRPGPTLTGAPRRCVQSELAGQLEERPAPNTASAIGPTVAPKQKKAGTRFQMPAS
jgi:hypothetical protein